MAEAVSSRLERRLGPLHARQRLGIEADHEAQAFGYGLNFFHIENWYSVHSVVRNTLRLTGLYWRGKRNAENATVRHNTISSARLPTTFDGFTVLHISDMHIDMNPGAMKRLAALIPDMSYDACVLTGDFRGATYGPFEPALAGFTEVRARIKGPVFGVLGNHDTIRMVPALEDMGIRMLLNECDPLERGGEYIYLAGIDDAHFYRVDNIEKAAAEIPGWRVLNPAIAHPGNLPAGSPRQFRSAARRPHPWRSDMFAGIDPDHAQFRAAAAPGIGTVELWPNGGLHFGRRRLRHRAGPPQLSTRNHLASSALRALIDGRYVMDRRT